MEPDPGEATAGDAVIEYTRDHLPVNMGVDTNQSDFTREQAEQLVGDIQEQLYETAKSQKRLRLVYDADRLGSALGRLRLLGGGHVDDLDVLPCGFVL